MPLPANPFRARWLVVAVTLVVAALGLPVVLASPAHADDDCSFDAATAVVTVPFKTYSSTLRIQVPGGSSIAVGSVGSATFCQDENGVVASPSNTDTIEITGTPVGFNPHSNTVFIDQAEGVLRPGKTPEASGDSEIEIVFTDSVGAAIQVLGAGEETVNLGNKDDHIVFGQGGINLNAGEADDDVDVYTASGNPFGLYVSVDGAEGNDTLSFAGGQGTGEPKTIWSTDLVGGPGDDHLTGGAASGSRPFVDYAGGPGDDVLVGTTTGDTASYRDAAGGVEVDLSTTAPQAVGGGEGSDTLSGMEDLQGGDGADFLTGDDNDNSLSGGAGDDTLLGLGGGDILAGDAYLRPSGDDTLVGGDGEDTLYLYGGADIAEGGGDDDTFWESTNGDSIDGGDGTDLVYFSSNEVTGGVAVDLMITGPQVLGGGMGTQQLTTVEDLYGTDFDDAFKGDDAANVFYGNEGSDELVGRGGDDRLIGDPSSGDSGDDILSGGAGEDSLDGGAGDNELDGGPDDDTLENNSGDEELHGGTGRDLLTADVPSSTTETVGLLVDLAKPGPQVTGPLYGTDTATGIEDVRGTRLADVLLGDAGPNDLYGGFSGTAVSDEIHGRGGDDTVRASSSITAGGAELIGGPGEDIITGGAGPDEIDAADGEVDVVDCRAGDDIVTADPDDTLTNCESAGEEEDTELSGLRVKAAKTQTQRKPAKVSVKVQAGCSEECRVSAQGTVAVGRKKVTLSKPGKQSGAGKLTTLTMKVTGKAAKRQVAARLSSGKSAQAVIRVTATDGAGNSRSRTVRVTLRKR